MNVETGLRFVGDYTAGGAASGIVWHTGYDLLGSGFGANLLAEEVCSDSMGHRLAGSVAGVTSLAVKVDGGGRPGLNDWSATLLLKE